MITVFLACEVLNGRLDLWLDSWSNKSIQTDSLWSQRGKGWKLRYSKCIPVLHSGTAKSLCSIHCDSSISLNMPWRVVDSLIFGCCDIFLKIIKKKKFAQVAALCKMLLKNFFLNIYLSFSSMTKVVLSQSVGLEGFWNNTDLFFKNKFQKKLLSTFMKISVTSYKLTLTLDSKLSLCNEFINF